MHFVLIRQVVTGPQTLTDSPHISVLREQYEPGVHTFNNANPYLGVTVTESHGKYPVIF